MIVEMSSSPIECVRLDHLAIGECFVMPGKANEPYLKINCAFPPNDDCAFPLWHARSTLRAVGFPGSTRVLPITCRLTYFLGRMN